MVPLKEKIILSAIILLLGGSVVMGIYLVRHPEAPEPRSVTALEQGNLLEKFFEDTSTHPASKAGMDPHVLTQISSRLVLAPVSGAHSSSVLFYEQKTGRVFETNLEKINETTVSGDPLPGLQDIVWSADHQSVIGTFRTSKGVEFRYYSYQTKKSSVLPTGTRSAALSPDGKQVVFFREVDNQGGLYLLQPPGTATKKILSTRITSWNLLWPASDMIYGVVQGANPALFDVLSVDLSSNLQRILADQPQSIFLWSPSGTQFVFSASSGTLTLHNLKTGEETDLRVKTTASKCAWDRQEAFIICGINGNTNNEDRVVSDSIVRIVLSDASVQKLPVSPPKVGISVQDPFISTLGNYLVFTNNYDELLYSLKLK